MLVSSTAGRAETRRSTMGDATRSSYTPQNSATTTAVTSRPTVRTDPQPHSAPWVTASSRQTSAADRPSAPTASKRPRLRSGDSGTQRRTSAMSMRPITPETQNMVCHSKFSMTRAATGRPMAAPIPSVELISATADRTRSGGSSSRRMLMPSGTTAIAAPCRARPVISTPMCELTAQSTEPTTSTASEATSTRRLPYMSPTRPRTGVKTAPVRSVTVTSQLAAAGVAPVSSGMCGSSGTTIVCMTATTTPQNASTPTAKRGCGAWTTGVVGSAGTGISAGMALRTVLGVKRGCTRVHPQGKRTYTPSATDCPKTALASDPRSGNG